MHLDLLYHLASPNLSMERDQKKTMYQAHQDLDLKETSSHYIFG